MSMDRCCKCDGLVDTDFDLDCYIPYPAHHVKAGWDMCVCERCQEIDAERTERDAAADVS